jgi:GH25 family lysozyme M1 (1,4-beta-N-acetylmuramidase)
VLKGIDISNFTAPLTEAQLDCMRAAGIQYVVVRAGLESQHHMGVCQQQLDQLHAAGFEVAVYIWSYPDNWSPEQTIRDTIAVLGDRVSFVGFYWIDVEQLPEMVSVAAYEDWIARALAEIAAQGKRGGLYTGRWYWADPTHLNNSTRFADVPLWLATFDQNGDFRGGGLPFGGWTSMIGEQYAGNGQQAMCGVNGDLNVFDDAVLPPPPPPTDPPVDLPTDLPPSGPDMHALYADALTQLIQRDWDDLGLAKQNLEAAQTALDRIKYRLDHDLSVQAAFAGKQP